MHVTGKPTFAGTQPATRRQTTDATPADETTKEDRRGDYSIFNCMTDAINFLFSSFKSLNLFARTTSPHPLNLEIKLCTYQVLRAKKVTASVCLGL